MAVSTFAAPSGIQRYEQLFTSSGTWTVPAGVKTCEVTALGGSDYGGSAGSSAGGYFKGIVDVAGATSVPITVGSGGTASSTVGGASSFGTYIAAPGGGAGAFYKPTTQGFTAGSVAITTGPADINTGGGSWYSGSYINQSYSKVTNNDRMYIYSNQNPGGNATSIDGVNWVTTNNPHISGITNTKIIYGGGAYISAYIDNTSYSYIYYSTDGISYLNTNLVAGYTCDFAYGPAGFIVSNQSTIAAKSTNGSTWTAVTTTGLPSNAYVLQATSSYYYAFIKGGYGSTAYRSIDGVTWTSFNLNAATSNMRVVQAVTYNNKVYLLNNTTTMQVIDGLTISNVTVGATADVFVQYNSIYIYGNATGKYYSVVSPTVPVTTNNFGIPSGGSGPAIITSSGIAFGHTANSSTGVFYSAKGYQGQAGFTWQAFSGYQTNGTPGVLSAGSASPSSTYAYGIPGDGNEDGWGCGVGGRDGEGRSSYGSGARYGTTGNQGVVRVRWWA